jgi:hypothetical protein
MVKPINVVIDVRITRSMWISSAFAPMASWAWSTRRPRGLPTWTGGPRPLNIPATFGTLTFWQYTDGVHGLGPYAVDGVRRCDRDQFNGSLAQLRTLWGGVA